MNAREYLESNGSYVGGLFEPGPGFSFYEYSRLDSRETKRRAEILREQEAKERKRERLEAFLQSKKEGSQ